MKRKTTKRKLESWASLARKTLEAVWYRLTSILHPCKLLNGSILAQVAVFCVSVFVCLCVCGGGGGGGGSGYSSKCKV